MHHLWKSIVRATFPYHRAEVPDPVGESGVVAVIPVSVYVCMADRLRILVSGRCEVTVKTITDHGVPKRTTTTFSVLPPDAWNADPPKETYPAVFLPPPDTNNNDKDNRPHRR